MQKNIFFQNSTQKRMTHFNTSIDVKRRKDKYIQWERNQSRSISWKLTVQQVCKYLIEKNNNNIIFEDVIRKPFKSFEIKY